MNNHKESTASPVQQYLKSRSSRPGPHPLGHLDHLAFAIIVDAGETPESALAALARLRHHFVDWNEIRVSRVQEVARALGDLAAAEEIATRIVDDYNAFFEKKGCLGFDFLESGKVAEGRKLLHQVLPRIKKGAANLLLYQFCPGASLPLSDEGLKAARKEGLVAKTGDRGQLGRLLTEELEPDLTVTVIQYLELDATGHPYGEPAKPASAAKRPKTPAKKPAKKK